VAASVSTGSVLLRGGSVYSPTAPFATALLVVDGEIAWVGEENAADSYADSADEVVQLAGRLVTPGFVDAHVHLAQTGFALGSLDLSHTASLADALAELERFAREHSGRLLRAHGWDESRWPEARRISGPELDQAVGRQAAYVSRIDGHSAVVSSALLAQDGSIATRDGWRGDGTVERDAHHAVRQAVHDLTTRSERQAALRGAVQHAARRGITSVHELNAPHIAPFDDLRLLAEMAATEPIPEVVPYWGGLLGDGAEDDVQVCGYAGDLNMDGAIGSRTACMHEAYDDEATTGHLYLDAEQVSEHVVLCTQRDLQAGFHVIGDRAMHEVVEGFRRAAARLGTDAIVGARHRLEHVEMPDADAITAMTELGVVASVQPGFDALWGAPGQLYDQRLGWSRAGAMNPFGSLHRAGVALAFGSDSPVTPLDPWGAVRAAAHHHDEEERLTVRAAFNAHTRGGHRARRRDDAGVLVPGASATYVVWDVPGELIVQTPDERVAAWSTDPRSGVPVLPDLHPGADLPTCVRTVVAGATIYDAEDES
jgi:predicted amidohydrolase YtcJ